LQQFKSSINIGETENASALSQNSTSLAVRIIAGSRDFLQPDGMNLRLFINSWYEHYFDFVSILRIGMINKSDYFTLLSPTCLLVLYNFIGWY
jgi:hypothetical protein